MKPLSIDDSRKLESLYERLVERKKTYLGYPNSHLLDNASLAPFLDLMLNNVGDPFVGNNGINSCELERELVTFFLSLFGLPSAEGWGYVTNGGTEGNLYGLLLAREWLPGGVLYFSEDSHYSLPKAARLLGIKHAVIPSLSNGEIDCRALESVARGLKHYPAIVSANIGTTMKGAVDDLPGIEAALDSAGVAQRVVHCDAALFGPMLPFLPGAPPFDFRLPSVTSIAISGHKFLGSPIPSGIVLARDHLVRGVASRVSYIHSLDATLSGSRDGFAVIVLWHALKRLGEEGLQRLAGECVRLAEYARERLAEVGEAWVNPFSNIVVFARPSEELVRKWQLATEGPLAHLVIMPGVDRPMVDAFVEELRLEKESDSDQGRRGVA